MGAGRYAPSPTSALHLGNLRTGVLAWLFAHSTGRPLRLRVENLDQVRVAAAGGIARQQFADLAELGLTFDGETWWQSDRIEAYALAAARLPTYECYCSRREIREAAQAPHADGYRPYPGTCADLSETERAERRAVRPPALRVRAGTAEVMVHDVLHGQTHGVVDDFVLRRNDGTWAYNLAVVVDDLAMGVDQVVRGDDLLTSAPRQAWLAERLDGATPEYAHVPLVVNSDQVRLAKRDGAVSLGDLKAEGHTAVDVLGWVGRSLRLASAGERVSLPLLASRFEPAALPLAASVFRSLDDSEPPLVTRR